MGRLAVLGSHGSVVGYALAGALVLEADDEDAVRRAWRTLPDDVDVVVLSATAAATLDLARSATPRVLTVVMPT